MTFGPAVVDQLVFGLTSLDFRIIIKQWRNWVVEGVPSQG